MQSSNLPPKIVKPFANAASGSYVNTIPVDSQIPTSPGRASLADGFPPLTFQPLDNGGVPPYGADMNGILKEITAIQQWQEAGGGFPYDASFSTTNNGYPNGAVVQSTSNRGYWLNTVDNNTTNPDTGGANWVPYNFYGSSNITLTTTSTTLTNSQAAYPILNFTGTLTANATVILPTWNKTWVILNNTTGNFNLQVKTAAQIDGITLPSGQNFHVVGGANIQLADTFPSLFTNNGYQKLPSGLIIQWQNFVIPSSPLTYDFTYPIAFPHAALTGQATYNDNVGDITTPPGLLNLGPSSGQVYNGSGGNNYVFVVILGY